MAKRATKRSAPTAARALAGAKAAKRKTVAVEITPSQGQSFKDRQANIEVVKLSFKGHKAQQDVAAPGSYRLQWRVWAKPGMPYVVAITAPEEAVWSDTFTCDDKTGFDGGLHRFPVEE